MDKQIRPGFFSITAHSDVKRTEFDTKNEQILFSGRQVDVVFFGDSITQNWDLEIYFNSCSLKINRGIGSDTVFFAEKRYEADVLQLNPKAVVMLLGINDLLKTAPDLWNKTPGADPEEILCSIEKGFRSMLSKSKDVKIYVCSVLPQSLCEPFDRKFFDKYIVKTNILLKKLCDEYSAEYVDYYESIAKDGLLPEEFTPDGVHPNAKCYALMAEILKKKVDLL